MGGSPGFEPGSRLPIYLGGCASDEREYSVCGERLSLSNVDACEVWPLITTTDHSEREFKSVHHDHYTSCSEQINEE